MPITHHDIARDIPLEGVRIVRLGFTAWGLAVLGYGLSWLVITLMLAGGHHKSITDWILASVIAVLGVPISWKGWYRALYNAQMSDKARHSVQFFVHASVHVMWSVWVIISPPIWLGTLSVLVAL